MITPLSYEAPSLDWAKLKALVHYICFRAPNPKKFGATKLNKILLYSDMEAYLTLGQPITGETYVKQQYGPVPKHILTVLEELEREQAIVISEATGYNVSAGQSYAQRQFFPILRPNLSVFSGEEISLVDAVVETICDHHTAASISEASHDVIWESAEIGEEIPYYTVYSHLLGEITPKDVDWAKGRIASRTEGA